MEQLEALQALWQKQNLNTERIDARIRAAAVQFRSYGAREMRITVLKTIAVAALLVATGWPLGGQMNSPWFAAGMALTVASIAVFLYGYWKNQMAIARVKYAEPSVEFLRASIAAIDAQERFVRRYALVLILTLTVDMNLTLAGAFNPQDSWTERITAHLVASVIPLALYPLILKIRGWRLGARHRDLRQRLQAIELAISETAGDR